MYECVTFTIINCRPSFAPYLPLPPPPPPPSFPTHHHPKYFEGFSAPVTLTEALECCFYAVYSVENFYILMCMQDMSAYVKKVHFKLHESYPNPNRGQSHLFFYLLIHLFKCNWMFGRKLALFCCLIVDESECFRCWESCIILNHCCDRFFFSSASAIFDCLVLS